MIIKLLEIRNIFPKNILYTQQIDTLGIDIKNTNGMSIMPYGVRNMNREYIKAIPLEDKDTLFSMSIFYRIDNKNPVIPKLLKILKDY